MNRRGYVLLGLVAGVAFLVALTPSRAVVPALERMDELRLLGATGRWWKGEADVVYRGFAAGRLAWVVDPLALFAGGLGAKWRLRHANHDLAGSALVGFDGFALSVAGAMDAKTVNEVLAYYHIHLGGQFTVDAGDAPKGLSLRYADGEPAAAGTLRWSGGRTTYRLSGQSYETQMPPMLARMATQAGEPVLRVYLEEVEKPVLVARLNADGWLHVGISRRFAALAGNPWPIAGDPDAVVVTVQEKVW